MVQIKRVYRPAEKGEYRILVDRLWPRGLSKEDAAIDVWLKEVAPSTELRTWFGHKPERFNEFSQRYKAELQANPVLAELKKLTKTHPQAVLVFGAKDPEHNHALVIQEALKGV